MILACRACGKALDISDIKIALEAIVGESSAFSEGNANAATFFRIKGLAEAALRRLQS